MANRKHLGNLFEVAFFTLLFTAVGSFSNMHLKGLREANTPEIYYIVITAALIWFWSIFIYRRGNSLVSAVNLVTATLIVVIGSSTLEKFDLQLKAWYLVLPLVVYFLTGEDAQKDISTKYVYNIFIGMTLFMALFS